MHTFAQEPGILCDIHVGGGDIWGADCGPDVFRFNFSTGNFDPILDPFSAFLALTAGLGGMVWGIDTSTSDVYRYDASVGFVNLGCCLTQIQAGGDGVWALGGSSIFRWGPSEQSFLFVPGWLVSISVGSGGGVWGVNSSHQVFTFSTP